MITTENSNDIYVGSTTLTLKARLQKHECHYRTGIYCSSSEIIKQGDYKIVLIKNFACNSLIELELEETRYQKDLVCVNKKLARLTEDEKEVYQTKYYIENKEIIKQYQIQYRIENKDRITERQKKYDIENKDRITERQKKYYIENKDRLNERQKKYYIENKDEILEYRKQYNIGNKEKLTKKFNCDCGGTYQYRNKSIHIKTTKHINYFKTKTKYIFKIKQ
jgi:hypothetical protein